MIFNKATGNKVTCSTTAPFLPYNSVQLYVCFTPLFLLLDARGQFIAPWFNIVTFVIILPFLLYGQTGA